MTPWRRPSPASRSRSSHPARAPATRSARCRSSRARATWTRPRQFYDWALSADAQNLALQVNAFQVPSNKGAETSPSAPDLSTIKLIDYDFKKYGSSDERKRLLQKWDEEVSTLPQ